MKQLVFLIVCFLISSSCVASLVVVNTDGPTVDATPYLSDIHYPKEGDSWNLLQMNKIYFDKKAVQLQKLSYPVISKLTPGKINSHQIETKGFTKPIFVIGDDPVSIQWAKVNANDLKKIGALGIITNVNNKVRTEQIEKEIGLVLFPANLDGLSRYLKIEHYPFLWTKNDVEQ